MVELRHGDIITEVILLILHLDLSTWVPIYLEYWDNINKSNLSCLLYNAN